MLNVYIKMANLAKMAEMAKMAKMAKLAIMAIMAKTELIYESGIVCAFTLGNKFMHEKLFRNNFFNF